MTDRDKLAIETLAAHLAYQSGALWASLPFRLQEGFRKDAADLVTVVSPIYQSAPK